VSQAHVVWLSGSIAERKAVLAKLLKQFEGSDVTRYGGDISYSYLEQQVMTTSCFSEKRLIIIGPVAAAFGHETGDAQQP
jgi:hypothetical protein